MVNWCDAGATSDEAKLGFFRLFPLDGEVGIAVVIKLVCRLGESLQVAELLLGKPLGKAAALGEVVRSWIFLYQKRKLAFLIEW